MKQIYSIFKWIVHYNLDYVAFVEKSKIKLMNCHDEEVQQEVQSSVTTAFNLNQFIGFRLSE